MQNRAITPTPSPTHHPGDLWPAECTLDETNEATFRDLVSRLAARGPARGERSDPLFRLYPERWLESLITQDVSAIDERLVYCQGPALASTHRAMLPVFTCTLDGRLAILEFKADEDIHLPLQGRSAYRVDRGAGKSNLIRLQLCESVVKTALRHPPKP